jgi:hypothetical protein
VRLPGDEQGELMAEDPHLQGWAQVVAISGCQRSLDRAPELPSRVPHRAFPSAEARARRRPVPLVRRESCRFSAAPHQTYAPAVKRR